MFKNEQEAIYIGNLISKKIQGTLQQAEEDYLRQWVNYSTENADMYNRCFDEQLQKEVYVSLHSIDLETAYDRTQQRILSRGEMTRKPRIASLYKYISAAVILVICGFSLYLFTIRKSPTDGMKAVPDYGPATSRASIILSDGRTISLDSADSLIIDQQNIRDNNGNTLGDINSAVFAKITTPRGGLYTITLADGTIVKLNAESSLEYPTTWAVDRREVSLQGEAYFEIAKNKNQPFIVNTAQQKIKVLGTHFNVLAYPNSSLTKTTLLEGSVLVERNHTDQNLLLEPGEQSLLQDNRLTKREVDVKQEVAWLYGKFNFDGKDLNEVIEELSRWYDVDITFEGKMPEIEFFGGTYRNGKISSVLDILKIYGIEYRIVESRRLILSPQKEQKGGEGQGSNK
ncbi:FecR family protein [Sphingobacterium faecale]|uniref:FecR domain-containing protein n=1 Tax=Sphingobacterium faecale TaxID=2803775 RepID=A0ABS1R6T0_9SPHI|nr:FecR family protein [Sphingobacterium faecale]MBL1410421.1 FecR domain-containing protein [Sphingobacterium faecale]